MTILNKRKKRLCRRRFSHHSSTRNPTGEFHMTTPTKPIAVTEDPPIEALTHEEQLDEEEQEFRALRQDLPGVKGASAAGIVSIGVGKAPLKNEFFRALRDFRPVMPLVDIEVGMEKAFFVVTPNMIEPLNAIGITVTNHTLYLTVTSRGALRVVPVRGANAEGDQNEYARTKEIAMVQAIDG
jgi:hypothetical protein